MTMYFMNVVANMASYLSPDKDILPLTDRLFEVLPSITTLWLTDMADFLLFMPTMILILTHYRPLYLFCKFLLTWALCNFMRITTVAITSYPDPRKGCIRSMGEFFTTFTLHRCGDCMFSGHTVIFVISALIWTSHGYHRFPRRLRWLAVSCVIFVWGLCIGSALIVIANRAHYTSDVLVAFYVAAGNFYLWTYLLDKYIEDKGRLRDLTHPWGDGPDPRTHIRKRNQRQLEEAAEAEKEELARSEEEDRLRATAIEIPPIPRVEPLSTSVYEHSIRSAPVDENSIRQSLEPTVVEKQDDNQSIVSQLEPTPGRENYLSSV
ncbi:hypothetical protein BGZ67_005201 [Mortierella alpina]|nr:hypothetical protein BGZ67_005201 [Mortierella alpina]